MAHIRAIRCRPRQPNLKQIAVERYLVIRSQLTRDAATLSSLYDREIQRRCVIMDEINKIDRIIERLCTTEPCPNQSTSSIQATS